MTFSVGPFHAAVRPVVLRLLRPVAAASLVTARTAVPRGNQPCVVPPSKSCCTTWARAAPGRPNVSRAGERLPRECPETRAPAAWEPPSPGMVPRCSADVMIQAFDRGVGGSGQVFRSGYFGSGAGFPDRAAETLWSQGNDAALNADGHGVSPIADSQLHEDVVHVVLDRTLGDPEIGTDLLVAHSPSDAAQDLHLSCAQARARKPLHQPRGDVGGNLGPAGGDLANGLQDLRTRRLLEEITLGSRLQRAIDVFMAIRARKDQDPRLGPLLPQDLDELHAAHPGQAYVEHDHVRPLLPAGGERRGTVGDGRNHAHVRLQADDRGQSLAHHGVVVDECDSDEAPRRVWIVQRSPLPARSAP